MSGSGERQARREAQDDLLVELLGQGFSYPEAGAFVGLVARSVGRRMADPVFRRRVSRRRGEVVAELTSLLVSGSREAISCIQTEMRTATRSADRLRAAALLLTTSLRFRHGVELEARLAEVETELGLADSADTAVDPDDRDDVDDEEVQR